MNDAVLPFGSKPISAKAETVATIGMFRDAFARRRCLMPAGACYRWSKTPGGKQPFAVARVDSRRLRLVVLRKAPTTLRRTADQR